MRTLSLALVLIVSVMTIVLVRPGLAADAVDPTATPANALTCIEPSERFMGKTAEQWRAEGPQGLAELMKAMGSRIEAFRSPLRTTVTGADGQLVPQAQVEADIRLLDQVAQQRDAYAAGLYWYTDLDEAIEEAKATGKPILSLRMLGQLCDEYSCANSRFFRTALYADASVGEMLREKFVLHWQSVRPVPVITIDMGDGRTIKRTITGNSAHYVLDQHGRVVECLPGLYGPDIFERMATEAHELAGVVSSIGDEAMAKVLADWHKGKADNLDALWAELVPASQGIGSTLGFEVSPPSARVSVPATRANLIVGGKGLVEEVMAEEVVGDNPFALDAGRVALGKFAAEQPLLLAVGNRPTPQQAVGNDELWQRVARHYAKDARLDASSKALMRHKTVPAEDAFAVVASKTFVEDPMLRMVRNFEGAVALDTAINEHLIHRQVHQWFIESDAPLDLDALNKRVYGELFLTPEEDPWLGLVPADTYSALDQGGLIDR